MSWIFTGIVCICTGQYWNYFRMNWKLLEWNEEPVKSFVHLVYIDGCFKVVFMKVK